MTAYICQAAHFGRLLELAWMTRHSKTHMIEGNMPSRLMVQYHIMDAPRVVRSAGNAMIGDWRLWSFSRPDTTAMSDGAVVELL